MDVEVPRSGGDDEFPALGTELRVSTLLYIIIHKIKSRIYSCETPQVVPDILVQRLHSYFSRWNRMRIPNVLGNI